MRITEPTVAAQTDTKETLTPHAILVKSSVSNNPHISLMENQIEILAVISPRPICQYNEDCPPSTLCDRLNRRCINPCSVDSCGHNAECTPVNHGIECKCRGGFVGNPYIECTHIQGCRSDSECSSSEACVNGKCDSPCECGAFALCDVINHKAVCSCPPGYTGNARIGCQPPSNPCDPNPCGYNALCELDRGNPVCYCPRGLTGNPFKNCSKYSFESKTGS